MRRVLFAWVTLFATLFFVRSSHAAPEAHLLRLDPRAGVQDGQPILTSVIELVQFTSMSEVVTNAGCASKTGDNLFDCISNAVEAKNSIWKAFPFPDNGANLLVRVDGGDSPATLQSKATWGASGKDPLVGTAWVIALDASSLMGARYTDAREVAHQFIAALGPNDIAKLIIFDDRISPYVANTGWTAQKDKDKLVQVLTANGSTQPSHQRSRPFFNQVKNIALSFGDIGNAGNVQNVPMHQAMVLLSNGSGREDASSASGSAEIMKQFLNKGRFPEDNPLSPKTPLPVISVYFPNAKGTVNDMYAQNDLQFMQDIANPEIGGFFDIVRTGQGTAKAAAILSNVKSRFNNMWVVKWRVPCLAATAEQTFNLVFSNTTPAVKPDGTFQNVPIAVDPTSWPLDINMAQTKAEADANPVHPGGTFRVYGNFCWGGDKTRAEAYFVPAGTSPNQNVNKSDPTVAKKVMTNLIAQNMRGGAEESSDQFVLFKVPDEEKLLDGEGDAQVTRLVVFDNKAKRASGVTAETVITLKAGKKPLNLPIILAAAGIVVVILLLIIVLLRGGGGKKRGGGGGGGHPPPQPVVAGNPYGGNPYGGGGGGAPPYGGGGYGGGGGYPPQGGGGYGAQQVQLQAAPAAWAPPVALSPPTPEGGGYPLAVAGGAPVEVRCPACQSPTLAVPGQASVCFSCGQPLPAHLAAQAKRGATEQAHAVALPPAQAAPPPPAVAAAAAPPAYPLTSQHAAPLEPPPNPYGSQPTSASIVGAAGQFAIRAGIEVAVGRDPAACPITLQEPRVSGVHATLKFENGQLMVRDEGSNNGTYLSGSRLPARTWTSVPAGAMLRFGPVEFTVKIE